MKMLPLVLLNEEPTIFVTSRQHLPHQFITTFGNEVGMLSYAYALAEVGGGGAGNMAI